MNILHVLSQFEVTGAEVYAVTLAREQIRRGHRILFASDTLNVPAEGLYIRLPIGRRSYPRRLGNIAELARLIRRQHIHVVHAHSRAASWVSFFATKLTRTPFISTVHGRQHLHASSRLFSVYGQHVIAVSESLKEHLMTELGLRREEITVIPNGLDVNHWTLRKKTPVKKMLLGLPENTRIILFVGRLTGPKGDIVRFLVSNVIPAVEKKAGSVFCIIGGLKVPEDIPPTIESANRELGRQTVILKDFQNEILPFLHAADLVIASGRVAMESILAGRPTVAFGESCYHGLVTDKNFGEAMKTNFGDTGVRRQPDKERIVKDLTSLLKMKNISQSIQGRAKSIFDLKVIEPQVQKVYEQARGRSTSPGQIPVLMYHRVVEYPPRGSKHGIWVTMDNFRRQMNSLYVRGYTPMTFHDYRRFIEGQTSLPVHPVILTFDDGYEDNYDIAFPVLQDFGFKAVIYLVAHKKRRTNFWDPDEPSIPLLKPAQIQEMARHGIEFGSHTVSHSRLEDLPEKTIRQEVSASKSWIEDILGSGVVSFAYPYGSLSLVSKRTVTQEGYSYAVAGDSGPLRFFDDFFEIRRTQVFPGTGSFGFWKKTQPWYNRYRRFSRL